MNDYFYADESDLFYFYQIPKDLFTPKFKDLDCLAKVLYGILLNRNSLSIKNNWVDEDNRIFIYFTRKEASEMLGVGRNKPTHLFNELIKLDLIQEVRQGVNKPNRLYVKKFYSTLTRNPENRDSRIPKSGNQESPKQGRSYTNKNYIDGVSTPSSFQNPIKTDNRNNFKEREYNFDLNSLYANVHNSD